MADSLTDTTSVPELVGLAAADAHDAALDARLLAVPQNAAHTGAGRSTVTNQRPRAGASATPGDTISIWVDDPAAGPPSDEGPDDDGSGGGGGGSRVPEGPKPTPTAGAA
ncbi:MAG TPA: PASTA domain-containing protein [Actinomycetospora sp.]|jgi:beta-lactam-binding protein with PASTA domain|uniref:PASTA domain-containing protein n=1 Tax=Actinomycetospora sp. TaxID=1872135 RepID=UPI002F411F6A